MTSIKADAVYKSHGVRVQIHIHGSATGANTCIKIRVVLVLHNPLIHEFTSVSSMIV